MVRLAETGIEVSHTFAALGIPLKSGRDFDAGDIDGRPLVAVVNEALVQEALAGEDAIGRTIFCPFDRQEGMTIVGVVGDLRQRNPAVDGAARLLRDASACRRPSAACSGVTPGPRTNRWLS